VEEVVAEEVVAEEEVEAWRSAHNWRALRALRRRDSARRVRWRCAETTAAAASAGESWAEGGGSSCQSRRGRRRRRALRRNDRQVRLAMHMAARAVVSGRHGEVSNEKKLLRRGETT
jgi:hypothetical protein